MKIQKNISLKSYNTFGIDVKAKQFLEVNSISELRTILKTTTDFFIISGGSNILLTKTIQQLVLHINIKGIEIVSESKNSVIVNVNAGENWHDFVLWCIENNFGGLENLSLIPGKVGTAPIQNIGAYGVEVKDCIEKVHAIAIKTQQEIIFNNTDCNFGYRNSIFKNEAKGKYIITNVCFKLTKNAHQLKFDYGAIKDELAKNDLKPSIQNISKSIIAIRERKLPDPKKIGNSGSFFKNPVVAKSVFEKLYTIHSKMPFYKSAEKFKIPAGWLIEQCGFKGKRFGNAGVHENQALVLVNYGAAKGTEILSLAKQIQESVHHKFGIQLEMEVNIY